MDEHQAKAPMMATADTLVELHHFLEDPLSRSKLYKVLCSYVKNLQHVPLAEVEDEGYELLQDVVVRAIEIADKYHGTGIMPWLLRIAINLIRQKRKSQAVHREKVVPLGDLHREDYPSLSDEEFFELFTSQIIAANTQSNYLYQDLKEAIASLSESDQTTLNYYVNYGYDHNEIARIRGIKPGAARTRYSRAISHLREKLIACDENKGGESDA